MNLNARKINIEGHSNKKKSDISTNGLTTWSLYGGNVLWLPVLTLTGFGILFVYSASSVYALQTYGNEFYFAKKQALFLIPAFTAAFIGAKFPLDILFKYIQFIFLAFVVLTFATHLPHIGRRISGAPRWLNLGFMQLQPAEFLKTFTLLFMVYISNINKKNIDKNEMSIKKQNFIQKHPILFQYSLLALAPIAIISQKDLGTTIVVVCACLTIAFINGLPKRFLYAIFSFLSGSLLIAIIAEPYRISRIMTFLNPFKDPLGAGFQIIQSFIAIANGGFLGNGIGESHQKLFFLPEAHTDFILAVITEEMGFIGLLVLALLYLVLYYAILRLILCAKRNSDILFASGVFTLLALTTIINMGVVAGAFPTKGLPLPFISNGGSALISNFFLIGLLSQISKRIHD